MTAAAAAQTLPAVQDDALDLGQVERWISIALGGALLGFGARHRGLLAIGAGLVGVALVARGVTRRDPFSRVVRQTPREAELARRHGWSGAAVVSASTIVAQPRAAAYAFWRDFTNLPRVLPAVRRIDIIDGQRARWTLAGPGGATVEWEAVIVRDEAGRRIGWVSEDDSDIRNAGTVTFEEADGGTRVTMEVAYEPPAGPLGRAVVAMLKEKPSLQVREGLERFRTLMDAR